MSDSTVAVAELSPYAFEWLTAAVHRLLVPFVVPDYFRGNVVLEGVATITRTYDTVEKWADALNADIKSADCHLGASSGRSVDLRADYSDGHFDAARAPQ